MTLPMKKRILTESRIYIIFLLYSLALLFFCTTSSPFYLMNTWNDSNIFFTMGKSMMHGLVPYKDLFEQKGPLLFLLNGLGYLMSRTSYTGVYIIQSISLSFVLYFAYRTARLYINESWSRIAAILLPLFIYYGTSYSGGGNSAEEYTLPFMMISMYYFIRYFSAEEHKKHKPIVMFIHGMMSGCILLIKFNIVGFWLGFGALIILRLAYLKEYKNIFMNIIMGITGVLVVFIPYIIYALITKSLSDAISTYLLLNFSYADEYSNTAERFHSLRLLAFTIGKIIVVHPFLTASILVSLISFPYGGRRISSWGRYALGSSSLIFFLAIYGAGHSSKYYIIPFTVFTLLGIIVLFEHIQIIELTKKRLILISPAIFITIVFSNYVIINHSHLIKSGSKKLAQQKFAEIINKEKNPSLLELTEPGATGGDGFMTAADTLPVIKYFSTPNIPYKMCPYPLDSQLDLISNRKVKFLITMGYLKRRREDFDKPVLGPLPIHAEIEKAIQKNYETVSTIIQKNGAGEQIYTLYKLKVSK